MALKPACARRFRGLIPGTVLGILWSGILLLSPGCGGGSGTAPVASVPGPPVLLAVVPFENLTSRADAGEITTRVFFGQLGQTPAYQLVEMGETEKAMEELGVRRTSSLTVEQAAGLGEKLRVERILLGSVLESSTVRTIEGEVPSAGVMLKLVEVPSGRLAWTKMDFITGEDDETVFGWGRERSAPKLLSRLAERMVRSMPGRTTGATATPASGSPPAQGDAK